MAMKRAASIQALLEAAETQKKQITADIAAIKPGDPLPPALQVAVHDLLVRYRSVLEYVAQEIAAECFPRPREPQFPIARYTMTRHEFVTMCVL
jgi:hypothetical protein